MLDTVLGLSDLRDVSLDDSIRLQMIGSITLLFFLSNLKISGEFKLNSRPFV
jgi:hypothetical protein